MVVKLVGSAKQSGERSFHLHQLHIGTRLTLCFLFIILVLLLRNVVLLWQFQQARAQAARLSGVDQELITVLQAHTTLMSFYERLDAFAHSENTAHLDSEVEALRSALLQDSRRTRNALTHLPPEVQLDPSLLPTLVAIQDALPAELDGITILAKSRDWQAVRLRLANQVRPLESNSAQLVENIDREVGEARAQAVLNIEQVFRRILWTVPITAVLTFLFAAFLGLAITRSITQPLGRLMEGSAALARGDFSHRVPVSGKDEIARLGIVFNDMIVRLQQLYRELQSREAFLSTAQKLSHTGSFGWNVASGDIYWSSETFRIFEFAPDTTVTIDMIVQRTHPEDRPKVQQLIERVSRAATPFDLEHRLLFPDGSVKYLHVVGRPSENARDSLEFVGAVTDITERKRAEEALRSSESYLTAAQSLSRTGSFGVDLSSGDIYWSAETYRIFACDPATKPTAQLVLQVTHPDDRKLVQEEIDRAAREGTEMDYEHRLLMADGSVKHVRVVGRSIRDESGQTQFVGAVTDITAHKRAEEALRRSEGYLAEAQTMTRSGSWAWNTRTHDVFWSQEMFRIFDYDPRKTKPTMSLFLERVHPEDRPLLEQRAITESTGKESGDSEGDFRIVLPDGTIKHLHSIAHPLPNESGEVTEVVGTTMDVTEQHQARTALETAFQEIKLLKDQLHEENIALREEIDRTSMFDEIVGESPALQAVLARVAKVAPTDSTVLITGETGTGKEIIARSIHKRSRRAARTFVSVNCAAVPPSLIASELFGHEKGAFTGAIQRRLGRFELAEGGTIFLDEIGELPAETQIALLRVLQEREFERVGGAEIIHADVRVIAATNRDLPAAIDAGTFRSDLYYRLNVFPIDVPPLRKRREDISLLVRYFIDRYSKKAGKRIRLIAGPNLNTLQSYDWPGNVRELQNVIERSVILCDTDCLTVDESWLSGRLDETIPSDRTAFRMSASEEKKAIEAALAETRGRVSGPSGAAAKLGIPASTLDSKIRLLKINKHQFKSF